LAFILPLVAMLTTEPEMLQSNAFREHTMQQNAIVAGPLHQLGSLQRFPSPNPLVGFKRIDSWR